MPLRVPILCAFALVASLAQHAGQSGAGAKFDPNELAEKLAKLNPEQREKLKGMFEPEAMRKAGIDPAKMGGMNPAAMLDNMPGDPAACAACAIATSYLGGNLEQAKKELAPTKAAAEKRAAKGEKAQTKRWLQQEYGAQLTARLESVVDTVCQNERIIVHPRLKKACHTLVEEHGEEIQKAVLEGTSRELCASLSPKCEGQAVPSAVAMFDGRQKKSEENPDKEQMFVGPTKGEKVVLKIVGKSFGRIVQQEGNLLVMLYHSSKKKRGVPSGFDGAAAAFYGLAKQLMSQGLMFPCGQFDLRLNDLPFQLELPSPKGVQFAFWSRNNKETPIVIPAVRGLDEASVRNLILEMVKPSLNQNDGLAIRQLIGEVEHFPQKVVKPEAKKTGRKQWKASDAAPVEGLLMQQECEMCGLLATDLVTAHNETLRKLTARKSAMQRRVAQSQMRGAKRWLEQEYHAELLSALEERLEGICFSGRLEGLACKIQTFVTLDGVFAGNSSLRRAPGEQRVGGDAPNDPNAVNDTTCALRIHERCPAAVADYADEIQRGVLDGLNAEVCTGIVDGCSIQTSQMFNHSWLHDQREKEEEPKPLEDTTVFKKAMGGGGGMGGLDAMMSGNAAFADAMKDLKIDL